MAKIIVVRKVFFLAQTEETVCHAELPDNLFFVVCVRGHAHYPTDLYTLQRFPFPTFQIGFACFQGKAVFAFLLGHVEFQQTGNTSAVLYALLVDLIQQFGCIHGMDEADEWSDILDLVRLQMTDKVPLDVLRQGVVFRHQFLHMAFAEDTLAAVVGRLYSFAGMVFAYGHQVGLLWQFLPDGFDDLANHGLMLL